MNTTKLFTMAFFDFVNNNNNFFKVDGNEKIMTIHQKIIDILNKKKNHKINYSLLFLIWKIV